MTHEHELSAGAASAMVSGLIVRALGLAAGIGLGILLATAFFPG